MQRVWFGSSIFLRQFRKISLDLYRSASDSIQLPHHERIESRAFFRLPTKPDYQKWFPKHMSIQFEKMEARLRSVDLLIEVSLTLKCK